MEGTVPELRNEEFQVNEGERGQSMTKVMTDSYVVDIPLQIRDAQLQLSATMTFEGRQGTAGVNHSD